jgi:hypothetical protein
MTNQSGANATIYGEGIEDFAIRTHRFHPVLREFASRLVEALPTTPGGSLVLAPEVELKILVYTGAVTVPALPPSARCLRSPLGLPASTCQQILDEVPPKDRLRVRIDKDEFLAALARTRLWITPFAQLPSGRAPAKGELTGFQSRHRVSTTPCFMVLFLEVWSRGVLNREGYHSHNCFDLAIPKGMALLLHEVYHIYQFYRSLPPFRMLWWYAKAAHDSLLKRGIWWSHRDIPFEVEACAFELQVGSILRDPHWAKVLQMFRMYR